MIIRPQRPDDDAACARLWLTTFARLQNQPVPDEDDWPRESIDSMSARFDHVRASDPDGALVAEVDGAIAGLCQAIVREDLWICSGFAVRVGMQGRGIGKALLEAFDERSRGQRGLIVASADPRAVRRYEAAGFAATPTWTATGSVNPALLPQAPAVGEGTSDDLSWTADVDRKVRGATRAPDAAFLLSRGAELIVVPGRGYAVVEGRPTMLAALDEDAGRDLLHAALARSRDWELRWIAPAMIWAREALSSLGFTFKAGGPLMTRGAVGDFGCALAHGAFG